MVLLLSFIKLKILKENSRAHFEAYSLKLFYKDNIWINYYSYWE